MLSRLKDYAAFGIKAVSLLAQRRARFVWFIVLSLVVAFTEGLGVAVLVPVLESMGNANMFDSVPILRDMSALFDGMEPADRLRMAALATLVIVLVRGGLLYVVQYLGVVIPFEVRKDLSERAYGALLKASMSYVLSARTGLLQNVIRTLPERVSYLLSGTASIIINALVIAVYLVLMLAISWKMTIAALVFLAAVSEGMKFLSHRRMRARGAELTAECESINQSLYETMNGLRLIHLSSAENSMMVRWKMLADREFMAHLGFARINQAIPPLFATASGVLICALILVASFAEEGAMVGAIILFMFLLFRLLSPVTAMNAARATIQLHLSAFDETERFMAEVEAVNQPDGTMTFAGLEHAIEFKNVGFTYPTGESPALRKFDLSIPKGAMVAVVGPSGAGKSTLAGLLTRFFDPNSGQVLVDGTDLRDFQIATWRRRIGMVSQDIVLFNDSVRNNIAFGREEASFEQVQEAARLACADEFILNLPLGYDTALGERGTRLSGGQQQRIALARAILADPDVMILDEATSNLDSITERAVQDAVDRLRHQRTLIVIAHRLSTIRRADVIVVMEAGRIVEQGRHDEMLAAKGKYWEMIQYQRLDLVEDDQVAPVDKKLI